MNTPILVLAAAILGQGIAATADEPAVRLAKQPITCCLADRCFVVDSLDACHTEAEKRSI
jgi:hypothetical protein